MSKLEFIGAAYLTFEKLCTNQVPESRARPGELVSPEVSSMVSAQPSADSAEIEDNLEDNGPTEAPVLNEDEFFPVQDKLNLSAPVEITAPLDECAGEMLVNQVYAFNVNRMNELFFRRESNLFNEYFKGRNFSNVVIGSWRRKEDQNIEREIEYTIPASSLVKANRAKEVHTYLVFEPSAYTVKVQVFTPEVPYGKSFVIEILFAMAALSDDRTRVQISQRTNFINNVVTKGIIRSSVAKGLKEAFIMFQSILDKYVSVAPEDSFDQLMSSGEDKKNIKSQIFSKTSYLAMLLIIATLIEGVHLSWIYLFTPAPRQKFGLELSIPYADFPDSFQEIFWPFVVFVVVYFLRSLVLPESVRQIFIGDAFRKGLRTNKGWFLSIAVVEAQDLIAGDSNGSSDPYVVIHCGDQCRRTSVKIQTLNPHFGELLEFDTLHDAPQEFVVEVFDYDGPFEAAQFLGRASVSLLQKESLLSNLWVDIHSSDGSLGGKVHLHCILTASFFNKNNGKPAYQQRRTDIAKAFSFTDRVANQRASRNFHHRFNIPDSEILLRHYSCAIRRKLSGAWIVGRLYLSIRSFSFTGSFLSYRVNFTVRFSDVDDFQKNTKKHHRMFNPSMTFILKKGKYPPEVEEASYGIDDQGRLKIRFQSFLRFSGAVQAFENVLELSRETGQNNSLSPSKLEKLELHDGEEEEEEDEPNDGDDVSSKNFTQIGHVDLPIAVNDFIKKYGKFWMENELMEMIGCESFNEDAWHQDTRKKESQSSVRNLSFSTNIKNWTNSSDESDRNITISKIQRLTVVPKSILLEESVSIPDLVNGALIKYEVQKEFKVSPESSWRRSLTRCEVSSCVVLSGRVRGASQESEESKREQILERVKRSSMLWSEKLKEFIIAKKS